MPKETSKAIEWAWEQCDDFGFVVFCAKTDNGTLVGKVRQYFNEHNIEYGTFSYSDLVPFLEELNILH